MLFLWLKGVKYFILFVIILCLCLKSKRSDNINKIVIINSYYKIVAIKSDLQVLHRPDLERPVCELVVEQIKD